jgi:hypothetical protein
MAGLDPATQPASVSERESCAPAGALDGRLKGGHKKKSRSRGSGLSSGRKRPGRAAKSGVRTRDIALQQYAREQGLGQEIYCIEIQLFFKKLRENWAFPVQSLCTATKLRISRFCRCNAKKDSCAPVTQGP